MPSTLQPLLAFARLAVSPSVQLSVVDRSGGSGARAEPATAPVNPAPEADDCHSLAPTVLAYDKARDTEYAPLAAYDRYRVLARAHNGELWASLNSPSRFLLPPPDRLRGPIGCNCLNSRSERGPRYGRAQRDLSNWTADLYDLSRPGAPFNPDLFFGRGPCYALTHRTDLAQWDRAWSVEREANGEGVQLRGDKWDDFSWYDQADASAGEALGLRAKSLTAPRYAKDERELEATFGEWAAATQEFRGRALERLIRNGAWVSFREAFPTLWRQLEDVGYFKFVPVGVWINDTIAMSNEIRELQSYGVPVYYRWDKDYFNVERYPELKGLEPLFVKSAADGPMGARHPRTPSGSPPLRQGQVSSREPRLSEHAPESSARDKTKKRARFDSEAVSSEDDQSSGEESSQSDVISNENPVVKPAAPSRIAGASTPSGRSSRSEREEPVAPYAVLPPSLLVRVEGGKPSRVRARDRAVEAYAAEETRMALEPTARIRSPTPPAGGRPSLVQRMSVNPRSLHLRLFVVETSLSERVLRRFIAEKDGSVTPSETAGFLVSKRMPFRLMVALDNVDTKNKSFNILVDLQLLVNGDAPAADIFSHWTDSARALLQSERVARAAVARGGLIARIAEQMGVETKVFRKYPSAFVCSNGSPEGFEIDGLRYYDDWLDDDELRVLVGSTALATQAGRSIMPPVEKFDQFYAGVWTRAYENWFSDRMDEIERGLREHDRDLLLFSRHAWQNKLKGRDFGKV